MTQVGNDLIGVSAAITVDEILIATTITLHTARRHLPISLTWWSFTFPVTPFPDLRPTHAVH